MQPCNDLLNGEGISVNEINGKIVETLLTSAESTFGQKHKNNRKKPFGDRECHQKGRNITKQSRI